jgi:membrane protease YdiL (CAAX protease family)
MLALGTGLAANTALGPLFAGAVTYPFTETVYNETLGLEAISLVLISPLAIVAGILALRGHRAGSLLALGPAGYAAYMLVQYVVGPQYATYQPSIALHLGLFALSGALLLRAWSTADAGMLPTPSRGWAIVVFLLAAFVVSRWLPAFTGMVSGRPVPVADPDLTMYWSIFLLDMGVIVPAGIATAIGLAVGTGWAGKALYALVGWFALVPPSVAAMSIVKVARGDPNASTGDTLVFVLVTLLFWALAASLYGRLFFEGRRRKEGSMESIAPFPSSKPLVTYFVLAFAITWLSILAFVASRSFRFDTFSPGDGLLLFGFMCLGPSTAGVVMTAVVAGREGLRDLWSRVRRWRASSAMWAIGLLTSPVITVTVLLVLAGTVSSAFTPEARAVGLFIGIVAGVLEEIGWSGFATPRLLRRFSPLVAGLVLGLIWASWHGLADYTGNIAAKGTEGWIVWFVTYWLIPLTGYRVLMTWVYAHTHSVLVAMAMHASWTGWQFFLSPGATTQGQDAVWHLLLSAGIWAVALIVVTRTRAATLVQRGERLAIGGESR